MNRVLLVSLLAGFIITSMWLFFRQLVKEDLVTTNIPWLFLLKQEAVSRNKTIKKKKRKSYKQMLKDGNI